MEEKENLPTDNKPARNNDGGGNEPRSNNGDNPRNKAAEAKVVGTSYEVAVQPLALYFHLGQFLPLCVIITLLAFFIMVSGAPIWALAIFLILYIVFYKISSSIAEKRALSQKYSRDGNSLTASGSYCGFFSRNTFTLDQISRIRLVQTPLMRFCKIWTIEFAVSGLSFSRIKFYGLTHAVRVQKSLINARATALNPRART